VTHHDLIPTSPLEARRDTPRGPSATEPHARTLAPCSECGHVHFDGRGYVGCPVEGCPCPMSPRVYAWPLGGDAA
jgi:hypothetical protein